MDLHEVYLQKFETEYVKDAVTNTTTGQMSWTDQILLNKLKTLTEVLSPGDPCGVGSSTGRTRFLDFEELINYMRDWNAQQVDIIKNRWRP